jgi:hypothetical protein
MPCCALPAPVSHSAGIPSHPQHNASIDWSRKRCDAICFFSLTPVKALHHSQSSAVARGLGTRCLSSRNCPLEVVMYGSQGLLAYERTHTCPRIGLAEAVHTHATDTTAASLSLDARINRSQVLRMTTFHLISIRPQPYRLFHPRRSHQAPLRDLRLAAMASGTHACLASLT